MQKAQAQHIVKETLGNPFNEEQFRHFIRNLLNHIEEEDKHPYSGQFIPAAFQNYISTLKRIGKYSDGEHEIDILIVQLKKDSSLERARSAQRNFVARYLNGSRGGKMKDAALVAFVSPDPADWRFSLVKMEYKFTEGKSGKIKVKEEFTPAKRWSFLVGKNENSHTAQSRLAPIVEDDQPSITLKQLEEAFNIEKVTKEFFEKYRELFLRVHETLNDVIKNHPDIKKDFAEKNVNVVDFSKKLLGQIVFLYFLQKKGWFGVPMNKSWGEGDKTFLRTLFEESADKDKNYFNDYLEPLFYEALAKERDDDFYSRFECKIPFLNGGLFDPISNYDWVNTAIDLPNDIFSNTRKTKDGDTGDGVLDIFDRYNFTVKEDEPLEKEVAVDPEMLGKVFENLLEVKDRKSKGTYYTPREIVNYMCEQSLANYLATELEGKVSKDDLEQLIKFGENVAEHEAVSVTKEDNPEYNGDYKRLLPDSIKNFAIEIDDKLATIKVCDPAIGSGAFPVGMMNAIVKARMVLSSYLKDKNRTSYAFKRDCIQNSLYGVDIDPGAVEIAKLRLWLSLVVDEDNIKQIKPLPNLDYKIMQGNSLLEEFEGIKLFDEKLIAIVDTGKEKQAEAIKQKQAVLQKEYFELHSQNKLTTAKQAELNAELKKLQVQFKKLTQQGKVTVENAGLFDVYNEAKKKADELKRLHKEFFETTQKSKKDNIKRQIEQLEWELIEATLKEQNKVSALKKLQEFKRSNTKPFFLWRLNFADVFEEKGGFDVAIANPPYFIETDNTEAFRMLRDSDFGKKYYEGRMDFFYFFIEKAGSDLSHPNTIITFITTNYWLTSNGAKKLREFVQANIKFEQILNFNEIKIFETAQGQHNLIFIAKQSDGISNGDQTDIILVDKLNSGFGDSLNDIWNNGDGLVEGAARYRSSELFDKNGHLTAIQTNPAAIELRNRLQENCFYLHEHDVGNGIDILQESVSKNHIESHTNLKLGEGVFILSAQELKALALSRKELEKVKPFYTTDNFNRYTIQKDVDHYLIYADRDFVQNIENYPRLRKHLDRFSKIMTSANKPYGLNRPRDEYYFKGDKLLVLRMTHEPQFPYVSGDSYVSRTFLVIKPRDIEIDLKFLSCLFNSKLAKFWFYNFGKRKGNLLQIDKEPLLNFPIKKSDKATQNRLAGIADKIISIAKFGEHGGNKEKISDLEHQIDELVYKLYNLTPEEIKIVEQK